MAWIGVDRDKTVWLYQNKPTWHRGCFYRDSNDICQPSKIDPNLLPFKVRVTNLYEIEIVRK